MKDRNEPRGGSVAEAIRERIRVLQEELQHWEEMLRQCEAADAGADDPAHPALRGRKSSTIG